MNITKEPFDDVKVRRAMNYAFNMREIIDTVLEGSAQVIAGYPDFLRLQRRSETVRI